jgi:hypothetical protein
LRREVTQLLARIDVELLRRIGPEDLGVGRVASLLLTARALRARARETVSDAQLAWVLDHVQNVPANVPASTRNQPNSAQRQPRAKRKTPR